MEWNLADLFESVVDVLPDHEVLVAGDRRLTYAGLEARANRLAHHLAEHGVGPGDFVGTYLYNSTEYLEATLAAYKLRAVPVNVNYRYVEDELRYLFDNADLVALVHGREFAPRIAAVQADCPELRHFVSVEDGSDADLAPLGAVEYELALETASPARDFGPRSGDDLYVLYTGGTTGLPKGVLWRQEDFYLATIGPLVALGGPPPEGPEDVAELARNGGIVSLVVPPLMHGAAMWVALMAFYAGGRAVLCESHHLDPDEVWTLIGRERIQSIVTVGDAMVRPLIEALAAPGADYDVSSLVAIGSGGALLSSAVKEQIRALLPDILVIDSLGASESGYQGSVVGADAEGHPRFAMGPSTTVLGPDHRPLPPGSGIVGALARRGHVPLGYYKDAAKTAATFVEVDGERWALPGDMAILEADGTITLLGRGSVSINSGGEKIYPEEVEAALKRDPDVFDAVVVGVPDERWGERVAAVVVPRAGSKPTLASLARSAREHIAGYKVPRELHLVSEMVRSPSGKADYRWAKATALATPPVE